MRYILVNWRHTDPEYPTNLYSEVDLAGWEVRKVEVYADGRIGWADLSGAGGDTRLGIEPMESLEEIAQDPQFEPKEIDRATFEEVWTRRCVAWRKEK